MTGGCLLCEMEQAAPSAVVFRDELWAAEVAPGYEVPGWFFLRVRRHAELLTGLDDAELSALGHRARDLVAAVTDATGAPATYLLHFGENYRHFHALVAARGADIPAGQRGGNILGLRPGRIDRAAAVALVPSVRAAYTRTARDAPNRGLGLRIAVRAVPFGSGGHPDQEQPRVDHAADQSGQHPRDQPVQAAAGLQ
jgi:diadenosine tetraphosphate (Ap4A) HIT family hydrolase